LHATSAKQRDEHSAQVMFGSLFVVSECAATGPHQTSVYAGAGQVPDRLVGIGVGESLCCIEYAFGSPPSYPERVLQSANRAHRLTSLSSQVTGPHTKTLHATSAKQRDEHSAQVMFGSLFVVSVPSSAAPHQTSV
jgi:hypothetical protein